MVKRNDSSASTPTLTLRTKRRIRNGLLLLAAIIFLTPTLFYLYWLVSNTFKPTPQIIAYPPVFIPKSLTFDHLNRFFAETDLLRLTWNSVFISGSTTVLGLLFAVPAAHGMVKLNLTTSWGTAILVSRLLPGMLALIGWYKLFTQLNLIDTYSAIVLTHLIYAVPLMTWIMIGYFEDTSPDLESAALIDGCSRLQAFLIVCVPIVRPGILVAAILVFVTSWNDFVRPLIFTGPEKRPLVMAVFQAIALQHIDWGLMMTAAFFVLVPVIVVTIILQKHIVAGLSAGAVK